jgi:beta-glucosidase-like glycosyl hydrolase
MSSSNPNRRSRLLAPARAAFLAVGLVSLAACGTTSDESLDDSEESALFTGTPKPEIGQFFMVEHYGVVASGYSDVSNLIRTKNLGAIILWNPTNASGDVVREMVGSYAKAAAGSGHPELFVAADQEEHGTQRFKSAEGFTDLVDGATLGRAAQKNGPHVCELHARITSREMASAGMNMALGTVSDIYTPQSGTPGMFRTRAISSDPNVVTSCIAAMTQAYGSEAHVVYITKHFPGLGNASGNTDVDPSVHTESTTEAAMERELSPYRSATAAVNDGNGWPLFGAMVSHASYPILDASNLPATLSPTILNGVLRASETEQSSAGRDASGGSPSFAGMHLRGLTVSDAFWTWGRTRNASPIEKRRLMAQSFIAGMDILMIAKTDFAGAWDYFQALYANQLPTDEQTALTQAVGAASFDDVRTKFAARIDESAARIHAAKSAVGPASGFMKSGDPSAASSDLVDEYHRLTR